MGNGNPHPYIASDIGTGIPIIRGSPYHCYTGTKSSPSELVHALSRGRYSRRVTNACRLTVVTALIDVQTNSRRFVLPSRLYLES